MAQNKTRSTPAPAAGTPWLAFINVALISAALGAIGTYLVMQSGPSRPAQPVTMTSATPAVTLPSPDSIGGPPPVQGDRNLGNYYYDQSNWPQAIRYYEAAMKAGADDADIRTDLGNAYQFSGRAEDALAQYNAAQQLNPNHEFSLFNQGGLYAERLHQPQKAIEVWNEYLRRFPAGRNIAAARQLIAQASANLSGAPVPVTGPNSSAAEEKLLRLVPPAPGKP
jgi:TPR repeat protein